MNEHERIRILLGYRGGLHRQLLAAALTSEIDLTVVAEVSRTDTVLDLAQRLRSDVVVLDLALPGTVAVPELCTATSTLRMLVLLDRRSAVATTRLLAKLAPRIGLTGTDTSPVKLVDNIRRLAGGESVLDPELALMALRSTRTELTSRERDVLQLTQLGATATEIAGRLCLSTGTVRNYLSKILTKTGARNRIEALRFAHDAGWL